MEELAIKNGILITPQGRIRGGLTISGGKISSVGSDGLLPKATQEIDVKGNVVLPGLIDPHVHLGWDQEERFRAECRSESITAALGGVTTMMTSVRFGNALESRLLSYQKAKELGKGNSFIDFKFNAFIFNQKHLDELERLMEEGIHSFKLLMGFTPQGASEIGLEAIDWGFAYQLFEKVARLGAPAIALIHCEEPSITHRLMERLITEGRQDMAAWAESRPSFTETMQVYSAGLMAQALCTPLYVVHVSAKESVDALRYFKANGLRVYGETCPHYLVLNRNAEIGHLGKVMPPLRAEPDQSRLWQGLREGTLDTIGSDHCPTTRREKEKGGLWRARGGFGGIGTILPILISEGVKKGRLTWEELVRVTSENVAKIFHIYPQKGVLALGADADLAIVDPHKEWILSRDTLQSASDFSVYEGKKVRGFIAMTFVRGKLVTENHRLVAERPSGEYLFPS